MRPRPSSRGERGRARGGVRATGASMRPRPSSRGERQPTLDQLHAAAKLQCGHGLQAVENRCCQPQRLGRGRCFNAATAFKPWRTRLPGTGPNVTSVASMRPRPSSRGERRQQALGSAAGRRFNAATAFKPWRTPAPPRLGRRRQGFNAATAFKPWRTAATPSAHRRR